MGATGSTGRSCINFKQAADPNLKTVTALIKQAMKAGGLNQVK